VFEVAAGQTFGGRQRGVPAERQDVLETGVAVVGQDLGQLEARVGRADEVSHRHAAAASGELHDEVVVR